jgi:hypothetical protein
MAKTKRSRSDDVVVVDLKELEWAEVLEVPVPSDLVWLAGINMLHPVQFNRMHLGLLIYAIREHAVKRPRERRTLERIAGKMERAMQIMGVASPAP